MTKYFAVNRWKQQKSREYVSAGTKVLTATLMAAAATLSIATGNGDALVVIIPAGLAILTWRN